MLTTTVSSTSTNVPAFASVDVSQIESDLSSLRSELSNVESVMVKAVDTNSERIDALELYVNEEIDGVKEGVDGNKEGLAHLLNRVNHFVRSLLKVKSLKLLVITRTNSLKIFLPQVKTLPAEVRTMERRLEALDESLAKIVQGGGGSNMDGTGSAEKELVALTHESHWWNKRNRQ